MLKNCHVKYYIVYFFFSGTKVPYEKLTPQQKKHREEAFATLRKIQQFLFPENPNNGGRLQ